MNFLRRLLPRRTRRVDVGTYKGPDRVRIAPIETVVDEGVMISAHAVRLAIKNRLIVDALRDRADYDPEELKQIAHEQLLLMADENEATALRLEAQGEDQPRGGHRANTDDVTVTETGQIIGGSKAIRIFEHRRRPQVHRRLADALRQRALEEDFLAAQVEEAKQTAWREVSRELVRHAREPHSYTPATPEDEADYSRHRDERMRSLVIEDLAALEREREKERAEQEQAEQEQAEQEQAEQERAERE